MKIDTKCLTWKVNKRICIVNVEGKYYAIENTCTHLGGPLNEGALDSNEVERPWHGSKYDVTTGEPTKSP